MVESIDESFQLVVQMSTSNNNYNQQMWRNSTSGHQGVPLIRLIPFQHEAPALYCIQKPNYGKLGNLLRDKNYRLIRASPTQISYVCHQNEVDDKAYEYMLRTNAYIIVYNLNLPNHQRKVRHLLNTMVDQLKVLLRDQCDSQSISPFQYRQMDICRSGLRLDYLVFIPDTYQQEQITFQPMTISVLGPLMPICRYLYRLLAPIYYNQAARIVTAYKGADIIPNLENYQQQGYLQPTTLFVTIHVKDLYTSITHEQLLVTLQSFLHDFTTDEGVQGMKTSAIVELTEFLLHHQYFLYQTSIYRQTVGGGTGLFYIGLLIEIYLFYWQQSISLQQDRHEIFARCFQEIFFTWNKSEETLQQTLKMMRRTYASIEYDVNIQTRTIHYLDVEIHRTNDCLQTHVHHDWRYEPYVLPFIHDATLVLPSKILHRALVRAVLCCSQLEEFDQEQQYIEYSFLFNQFSFSFIRQQIEAFFVSFNALDLMLYHDQVTYDELRRHIRQWNQDKMYRKEQRLDIIQKQCIWYIPTHLKGRQLTSAKRNPMSLLPPSYTSDPNSLQGLKIEVIGIPYYPWNTL